MENLDDWLISHSFNKTMTIRSTQLKLIKTNLILTNFGVKQCQLLKIKLKKKLRSIKF